MEKIFAYVPVFAGGRVSGIFMVIPILISATVLCFAGLRLKSVVTVICSLMLSMIIGLVVFTLSKNTTASICCGAAAALILCAVGMLLRSIRSFWICAIAAGMAVFFLTNMWIAGAVAGILGITAQYFFRKYATAALSSFLGAVMIICCVSFMVPTNSGALKILIYVLGMFIGVAGFSCQLFASGSAADASKKKKSAYRGATISELKYPGMQRAYRNYCIMCGCPLKGGIQCPQCGFEITD